jgi:hypothetical protein
MSGGGESGYFANGATYRAGIAFFGIGSGSRLSIVSVDVEFPSRIRPNGYSLCSDSKLLSSWGYVDTFVELAFEVFRLTII